MPVFAITIKLEGYDEADQASLLFHPTFTLVHLDLLLNRQTMEVAMIAVHRDYCLSRRPDLHAHIEVNPVGKLRVEIVELQECHSTEFNDLSFENHGNETRVCGRDDENKWQFKLAISDADELSHLVDAANEEYEILMNDLM